MQISKIKNSDKDIIYLRSNITEHQEKLIKKLKLVVPNDVTPQTAINQFFK